MRYRQTLTTKPKVPFDGYSAKPPIFIAMSQNLSSYFTFTGETSRLYSLKFIQNNRPIEKKNEGGFQEIKVTNFPMKK